MKQQDRPVRALGLGMVLAALLLGGCARVNDTSMRLVSSKVNAFLIVNGQLLGGSVLLVPDRTGRVSFEAEQGPVRSCSGSLRYTATSGADIDVRCNDGAQVALQTTLLSETRGYGYGSTAKGPASIVFGLPMQEALAYLTVPPGMGLKIGEDSGELELKPLPTGTDAAAKPAGP
ncbi:MAG: hypothetical protein HXX19_17860 [Rhodoferax sp.]|nr:hypothetical protein [Rhodoferax sp.]